MAKYKKQFIRTYNITLGEQSDLAWAGIKANNGVMDPETGQYTSPPILYRMGTDLVRLVQGHRGPQIDHINIDKLRYVVDRTCLFFKPPKRGAKDKPAKEPVKSVNPVNPDKPNIDEERSEIPVAPPLDVIRNMLAAPSFTLPELKGITQVPQIAKDGTMHIIPGYNSKTGYFYSPYHTLSAKQISVPDAPTLEDAQESANFILDNLFIDFPWANRAHDEGYAMAMLLQPFVQPMIKSFTPFFLVDKPQPGSGATKLCQQITYITSGGRLDAAASLDISKRDDENAKKLHSVFSQGPQIVFLDNIIGGLESKRLTETITSHTINDRVLGASKMASYPVKCLWMGTGNNPKMSPDMVRRTIRIRLDAGMAHPELRTDFKHKDLELWVYQNLAKLISACLTIIRYWILQGAPLGPTRLGGGFEHWAAMMAGILDPLGVLSAPFLTNRDTMHEHLDDEDTDWKHLTQEWWRIHKMNPVTTTELWQIWANIDSEIDLGQGNERSQTSKLGRLVMNNKDRHIGNYKIALHPKTVEGKKKYWHLQKWVQGEDTDAEAESVQD